MRRARLLIALATLAACADLTGCLYASRNIDRDPAGGYKNYPASVEAEQARRAHRRKVALIGGPIELVGGAALTALALYAPSAPDDDGDDSVTDNLGDAGKDVLGRLALAMIGSSVAVSGVGDTVLGLTDPAFDSPLVRHGRLVAEDEIDLVAPPAGPRLGFHATDTLSLRATGAEAGLGLGHWLGRHVRVREAIGGGWEIDFGDDRKGLRYTLGGDLTIERASSRRHLGLYPRSAYGVFAGASWTRIDDRDRAVVRGGLTAVFGGSQLRLGAVYVPGRDDVPTIELGIRRELETD